MTCAKPAELLRHRAGLLPFERASALEAHLSRCERCTAARDRLLELTERLAPGPGELDAPAFADEVMTLTRLRRAAPKAPPASPLRKAMPWLAPAVAALCAGLLVLLLPR